MSVQVTDLLTASPAPVTGNPTPVRTWQWLRDGAPISGATSQTYTVQPADEGAILSVQQIETNLLGVRRATSLALGPVQPITLNDLTDVLITDPQDGDELVYRDGAWRNEQ
jgi:hypothetical protein